jgi:hypothetical protein
MRKLFAVTVIVAVALTLGNTTFASYYSTEFDGSKIVGGVGCKPKANPCTGVCQYQSWYECVDCDKNFAKCDFTGGGGNGCGTRTSGDCPNQSATGHCQDDNPG